jgi:hypothetical protein
MTIEKTINGSGSETVKLTKCPVCGKDLENDRSRVLHLATHDTTDFGLSERWDDE